MNCARTLIVLIAVLVCGVAWAQTLTVRLIDAKNGKPMTDKNVTVTFNSSFANVIARTGANGEARLSLPSGAKLISLREGPRDGAEPNRVAYLDCNSPLLVELSLAEALQRGITPENKCGKSFAKAKPGEIIFWGEPLGRWNPDFQ